MNTLANYQCRKKCITIIITMAIVIALFSTQYNKSTYQRLPEPNKLYPNETEEVSDEIRISQDELDKLEQKVEEPTL